MSENSLLGICSVYALGIRKSNIQTVLFREKIKFVLSRAAQECNISPKGDILSAQQKFSPPQVEILSQLGCEILSIFAENR